MRYIRDKSSYALLIALLTTVGAWIVISFGIFITNFVKYGNVFSISYELERVGGIVVTLATILVAIKIYPHSRRKKLVVVGLVSLWIILVAYVLIISFSMAGKSFYPLPLSLLTDLSL